MHTLHLLAPFAAPTAAAWEMCSAASCKWKDGSGCIGACGGRVVAARETGAHVKGSNEGRVQTFCLTGHQARISVLPCDIYDAGHEVHPGFGVSPICAVLLRKT